MYKLVLILIVLLLARNKVNAQHTPEEAYHKLMDLTELFNGNQPYSCSAIVEIRYKNNSNAPLRDTSVLIYRNRSTYYKSKLVERVEASQGSLIVNHELKSATFELSDSIRKVLQKELNIEPDRELESMLDSNFALEDMLVFNKYITEHCNVKWDSKDGLDEILFTPKITGQTTLVSLKIRFDKESRMQYYEYTNREVYAADWEGNSRFRVVRTIYDNFIYDHVPDIPSRLADFLEWNGWKIKLKKYPNYKLSVL